MNSYLQILLCILIINVVYHCKGNCIICNIMFMFKADTDT